MIFHSTWQFLIDWTERMAIEHGGIVYDKNGKRWDWGQALCRELYGAQWMDDDEFNKISDIDPEDPCPEYVLDRAKAWESGDVPSWVEQGE